jgi:hypothetical protein
MRVKNRIFFILLSHNNDYERLKYYPEFLNKENRSVYFIGYGAFDKNIYKLDWPIFFLPNNNKLILVLKLSWLFLITIHRRIVLISAHKSQIKESSLLGRLIRFTKGKQGIVCFVPHGVNSYEMEPETNTEVVADVVLYNTSFELEHTVYKKYIGTNVKLIHIGDLKLLQICKSDSRSSTKYDACILASNLNRYGFSDEEKLNVIRDCIVFVSKSFNLDNVVFRPHPRYLHFATQIKIEFPSIHLDSNEKNEQTILQSKYVVSVTSSVAYEALLLNKLTVIVEPDHFKNVKSVFSGSCLQHFYSSQLKEKDLLSIPFDLPSEKEWVLKHMVVSPDSIIQRIAELS